MPVEHLLLLPALLALAIATCACVATMDIALEALVVETVPAERRAFVASAKLCGGSLGGILGVGVLVGSYDSLGWPAALLACAALDALCLLPILAYPEARLERFLVLNRLSPDAALRPGDKVKLVTY